MMILGNWRSKSLRFKLIAGVMVSLIPILAIVIVSYSFNRIATVERSGNLMVLMNKNGTRDINNFLADQTKTFLKWTDDENYGLAIEYQTLDLLETAFATMLDGMNKFSLIMLTDDKGKILISRGRMKGQSIALSNFNGRVVPGVNANLNQSSIHASLVENTFLGELGDSSPHTIMFSYPVENSSGQTNGILLAFVDWSEIQKRVITISDEIKDQGFPDAWVGIVDKQDNMFLAHSSSGAVGTRLNSDDELNKWLNDDHEFESDIFNIAGENDYVTYGQINTFQQLTNGGKASSANASLYLTLFVPEENILGQIYTILWISFTFGFTGLALSLMVAYFLNRSIAKPIEGLIQTLYQSALRVDSASTQISSTSQSLASGASEQASSLEETASSLEEMAGVTRQNADNAKQANILARDASVASEKGSGAMKDMVDAMQRIKTSSDETAKIIRVIDEIAFQTNLLALNAAVEAARAGEAGKGFAVVAEEVRNLAQRCADAARNTGELIEDSQKDAERGVKISEDFVATLNDITSGVKKVTDLIGEVSAASDEQAQGIEQINNAVSEMEHITQQNAANAEESSSASQELASQAIELNDIVGRLSVLVQGENKTDDGGFGDLHENHADTDNDRVYAGTRKKSPVRTAYNKRIEQNDEGDPSKRKKVPAGANIVIPLEDDDLNDF